MMNAKPILLGVNIDHVATLRQARYRQVDRTCGRTIEPDPVFLALLAERAGADGITVHLREDRRHIQEDDVRRLRESMATRLNLEMACTPEMVDYALQLGPESVCLVPEGRDEVTTEGGLDVAGQKERVREVIHAMQGAGITTSLFIEADLAQIEVAGELGGPWIELHTGSYANAYHSDRRRSEFDRLCEGSEQAHRAGLTVNAGHGVNYVNIAEVRTLPHLHELNIGHSIICRSLSTGMEAAVREMKTRMGGAGAGGIA